MPVLLTDDRSYLSAERSVRWALGTAEAPALTLNAADAHGCAWLIGDVDGWDFPTVDLPMDRRPDGHGGFAGTPTYEVRTLTVEGTVTAPTPQALDDAHGRLRTALLGALGQPWRWTALDESPPRGLWVHVTGKPLWRNLTDRAADFGFVLVAEDPIKTGAATSVGPVRLTGTESEGGIPAPWTAPLTVTGAVSSAVVGQIPNEGDEAAHAVYTLSGPVPQPLIQITTGEYVHLRLTLAAADVAVINTADGTVTVNGVNRYDAWGPGSTFPLIPPGGAEVRWRSYTGGADPAAALTVSTAPAWR